MGGFLLGIFADWHWGFLHYKINKINIKELLLDEQVVSGGKVV